MPQCGKTSSFVYGEVIGMLSPPGEAPPVPSSLSFFQSIDVSSDTSWLLHLYRPSPSRLPLCASPFPVSCAAPPPRLPNGACGLAALEGVAIGGETAEAARKTLTGRMSCCPPPPSSPLPRHPHLSYTRYDNEQRNLYSYSRSLTFMLPSDSISE